MPSQMVPMDCFFLQEFFPSKRSKRQTPFVKKLNLLFIKNGNIKKSQRTYDCRLNPYIRQLYQFQILPSRRTLQRLYASHLQGGLREFCPGKARYVTYSRMCKFKQESFWCFEHVIQYVRLEIAQQEIDQDRDRRNQPMLITAPVLQLEQIEYTSRNLYLSSYYG